MFTQLFRGSLALVAVGASLLFINAPDRAPLQIIGIIEDAATGDLRESDNLYIPSSANASLPASCPASKAGTCRGA